MNAKGKLILIPVPITENAVHTLSPEVLEITAVLKHYFVENARTARRFLRRLHASLELEPIQFSEIDKHNGADISLLKKWLKEGLDVGVMSESGCPGIADPGAVLTKIAHEVNATVVSLTGPSSILLALMASGLNGQSFAFAGYLPVKEPAKNQRIKQLENHSAKENQTQILIETPYRNKPTLQDLLKNLKPQTALCIAYNLTGKDAFVKTKKVKEWQQKIPELEKMPCVFLFLA